MSKRPPLGKLALASKRGRERQLLDREQRERDCRDLLSSVGKNSSLAASSCSGQDTPSHNKRYAARVASLEKARHNTDADIRAVLGYASGKIFENFIQFIDNGMYSLSLKEGKGAANLDSDDDNEVLGQVVCDDEVEKKLDDDVQEVTTEQSLDSWNPF